MRILIERLSMLNLKFTVLSAVAGHETRLCVYEINISPVRYSGGLEYPYQNEFDLSLLRSFARIVINW